MKNLHCRKFSGKKHQYIHMSMESGPAVQSDVQDAHAKINDQWTKGEQMGKAEGSVDRNTLDSRQLDQTKVAVKIDDMLIKETAKINNSPLSPASKASIMKVLSDEANRVSLLGNKGKTSEAMLKKVDNQLAGIKDYFSNDFEKDTTVETLMTLAKSKNKLEKVIPATFNVNDTTQISAEIAKAAGSDDIIRQFQGIFGLPQTGKADIQTLQSMASVLKLPVQIKEGERTVFVGGIEKSDKIPEAVRTVQKKIDAIKKIAGGSSTENREKLSELQNALLAEIEAIKAGKPPIDHSNDGMDYGNFREPVPNAVEWANKVAKFEFAKFKGD